MKPEKVIFLGVLSACCHAGSVEDGIPHFDAMAEMTAWLTASSTKAASSTCSAATERLEELVAAAMLLFLSDASNWGSACRVHGHVDRAGAGQVMRRMADYEKADARDYVHMSNMYA